MKIFNKIMLALLLVALLALPVFADDATPETVPPALFQTQETAENAPDPHATAIPYTREEYAAMMAASQTAEETPSETPAETVEDESPNYDAAMLQTLARIEGFLTFFTVVILFYWCYRFFNMFF